MQISFFQTVNKPANTEGKHIIFEEDKFYAAINRETHFPRFRRNKQTW